MTFWEFICCCFRSNKNSEERTEINDSFHSDEIVVNPANEENRDALKSNETISSFTTVDLGGEILEQGFHHRNSD